MLKDVWAENINGTANDDNITGTINQDMIKGLGGNDTLSGQEAGDDISGGDGDDVIFGGDGRDFLRGKSGNDQIDGGGGNDRLYGYNGNDILIGGPGNDVFIGGPGADKFICGTGKDTVSDFNQTEGDVIPDNDCETINKANALDQVAIDSDQGEEQQQEIFNFQNQSLEGGADQTIQDSEDNIMREDNGADNGDPVSNIFKFFK
jgi:Ca2+-binding RTX toxin-like protein